MQEKSRSEYNILNGFPVKLTHNSQLTTHIPTLSRAPHTTLSLAVQMRMRNIKHLQQPAGPDMARAAEANCIVNLHSDKDHPRTDKRSFEMQLHPINVNCGGSQHIGGVYSATCGSHPPATATRMEIAPVDGSLKSTRSVS